MTAEVCEAPHWIYLEKRLKFSFGGLLLHSVRFQAALLNLSFFELGSHPRCPENAELDGVDAAIVYSQPLERPLERIRFEGPWLRYARSHYRRFLVDLSGTFDEYERKFSNSRRKHLRSMLRRFAEESGGAIDWREYRRPNAIGEFHVLAREVSHKTYQEKMVDAGLPDTPEFRQKLRDLTESGSARGYILFHQGTPIAYEYCSAAGPVLTCEWAGYDPAYRQHSPGFILLLLTLERLFAEKKFEIFDFGRGEYSYKHTMATRSVPCADLYYFRRSAGALFLVFCHAGLEASSRAVSSLSARLGLREKLKRMMRARYAIR